MSHDSVYITSSLLMDKPLGKYITHFTTFHSAVPSCTQQWCWLRPNSWGRGRGQNPEDEDKITRPRTRPRTFFLVWEDIHIIVSNYTRQSSHACMPHTKNYNLIISANILPIVIQASQKQTKIYSLILSIAFHQQSSRPAYRWPLHLRKTSASRTVFDMCPTQQKLCN